MKTEAQIPSAPAGPLWAPPRWAPVTAMLLCLGGLGVSSYLTVAHYASAAILACPDTGVVNCEKVTTSPQSVIFGVPVAVLGLAFFATMILPNRPRAWRQADPLTRLSRLGLATVGVGFVFYLVYTELFTIHAICLWCTATHVLAVALFAVVVFADSLAGPAARIGSGPT